jgi:hypothetical protein
MSGVSNERDLVVRPQARDRLYGLHRQHWYREAAQNLDRLITEMHVWVSELEPQQASLANAFGWRLMSSFAMHRKFTYILLTTTAHGELATRLWL